MSEQQLSQKAEMVLDDLAAAGGILNPQQSSTFLRLVLDQPTLIREVRTVPMNNPRMEMTRIGFGETMLQPARQTPGQRRLTLEEFTAPSFGPKIELSTQEVIAEVRIPYETLEDNIERGEMENTILSLIAERAALDMENLLINGDTSLPSNPGNKEQQLLRMMDGALRLVDAHVVDAQGAAISPEIFNDTVKALPTRFRRNRNLMRFYSAMDVEQDYRLKLANRGTGLGDAILTGTADVPVFGTPLKGVGLMPQDNILYMNPQNIIFGIQRQIRVESERKISDREVKIVLTARIGMTIEDPLAAVKVVNLD